MGIANKAKGMLTESQEFIKQNKASRSRKSSKVSPVGGKLSPEQVTDLEEAGVALRQRCFDFKRFLLHESVEDVFVIGSEALANEGKIEVEVGEKTLISLVDVRATIRADHVHNHELWSLTAPPPPELEKVAWDKIVEQIYTFIGVSLMTLLGLKEAYRPFSDLDVYAANSFDPQVLAPYGEDLVPLAEAFVPSIRAEAEKRSSKKKASCKNS